MREITLLSKLKHKNILNLIEVVHANCNYLDYNLFLLTYYIAPDKTKFNISLVFEYMEHDLNGIIDKKIALDISQIKCIMRQILEGIAYLHSMNVMHRDIKGSNILMNNKGDIKIGDFGLARSSNSAQEMNYTNRVVTLWYRSPELLLGSCSYTTAIDLWSVGCLFAELLTLRPLFPGKKESSVLQMIFDKCGVPTEEIWPGVSSLKNFKEMGPKGQYSTRKLRDEFKGCGKYS